MRAAASKGLARGDWQLLLARQPSKRSAAPPRHEQRLLQGHAGGGVHELLLLLLLAHQLLREGSWERFTTCTGAATRACLHACAHVSTRRPASQAEGHSAKH